MERLLRVGDCVKVTRYDDFLPPETTPVGCEGFVVFVDDDPQSDCPYIVRLPVRSAFLSTLWMFKESEVMFISRPPAMQEVAA